MPFTAKARRLFESVSFLGCLLLPWVAVAESDPAQQEVVGDPDLPWLDNRYYKVELELRPRIEIAKQNTLDQSQAYTIRTHAGLLLKPWEGFSSFAQVENVWSLDDGAYNNGTGNANDRTVIPDPESTELNQVWLQFERDDLLERLAGSSQEVLVKAKAGRQAIIYDDARFLGNVNWRQNEQTFDAVRSETDFGLEGLSAEYAYLWDIQRIFADKGGPSTKDYSSNSHAAHVHYAASQSFEVSVFAYFLDFENDSPANSSNTYGARATGTFVLDDDWTVRYAASYAYQTDAAKNPTNYHANYVWAGGDVIHSELGSAGVAYEMLGSDDGNAQFVTPLATAHKFNGLADVFTNNGGPRGLQDLQVRVSPKLPWGFQSSIVYHEFFRANGGQDLGSEIDALVTRSFNDYLDGLIGVGWFEGRSRGPADRWKFWLQMTFHY